MKFYLKFGICLFALFVVIGVCGVKKVSAEEKKFSLSGELGIAAPYVDEYTGERISSKVVSTLNTTLTHNATGAYLYLSGFATQDSVDKVSIFGGRYVEDVNSLIKSLDYGGGASYYPQDRTYYIAYANADFQKIGKFTPFVYAELDNPGMDFIWKAGVKSDELIPAVKVTVEIGGSDAKAVTFARGTIAKKEPVKVLGMDLVPYVAIQKGFGGVAGTDWQAVAGVKIPLSKSEEKAEEKSEEKKSE